MAMRRDDLDPDELVRKRAIERSWAAAQAALIDETFRECLEASIRRVNRSSAGPLTREEFLAQTLPPTE